MRYTVTPHLLPLEAETGRRLVERSLPRRSRRELRVEEHGADTELAERRNGTRVREPRDLLAQAVVARRVETSEAVHDLREAVRRPVHVERVLRREVHRG